MTGTQGGKFDLEIFTANCANRHEHLLWLIKLLVQGYNYYMKMTEIQHDQNLMIVYAVEGYSSRHNLPEKEVLSLFKKYGINQLIRKNYNTLHTQDFDESISFAEDVLAWKQS